MNTRLLVLGSVRALARNKLRSFFMSLGIVVGVAALVFTRSYGSGAEQEILDRINRMFSAGSIMIVNGSGVLRGGIRTPGRLTRKDVEALGAELDEIVDWSSSLAAGGREVQAGDRNRSLLIVGTTERTPIVENRGVTEGEPFSAADVASAARVALLGRTAADALFGSEDPIGQRLLIDGSPYRIQGLLEAYGVDPHGLDRDDEVHVPITTMMRRLIDRDTIGTAKLIVADADATDEAVDRVADLLRRRHGLADDQPDDFTIFTPTQIQERVREASQVLTLYLPATAAIALLVAAIVIANILLLAVSERVPEIGLRKAVGATDRQISFQFFLESLVVTVVSGLAGVALGAAALLTLGHATGTPASPTPDSILLGLAAALIVGLAAGLLPARRAARLEPVDALR